MAVSDELELRHAVLGFYREELAKRYQLANVRRFPTFNEVPDSQVESLREYFMECIYPPPKDRDRLDRAFDRLGLMLRSPRRMQPLIGAALKSMWKLGTRLPAAVSAGNSTIDAYLESRKLESRLVHEAEKLGYDVKALRDRHSMLTLIRCVPEDMVVRLVKDIVALFHSLSNVEMLRVALQFMETCERVMKDHPKLYDADDLEGIHVGLQLLKGGLELFEEVQADHFPLIIEGIEQIEMDWFDAVRAEAVA